MAEEYACCGGVGEHEEWCPTHIRTALGWIEPGSVGEGVRSRAEVALRALTERDGLVRAVTVSDILPLARDIYSQASIGCCLHLPLAYGKIDNLTLKQSIEVAKSKQHPYCETLGRVMLRLNEEQRERLAIDSRK